MKYIIKEYQCGYLLKNGIFKKILLAGKYHYLSQFGYEVKVVIMSGFVDTCGIPLDILMKDTAFAKRVVRVQIPDTSIALHFVNGCCKKAVLEGDSAHWNVFEENEFRLIDVTSPVMSLDISKLYINCLKANLYKRITIDEGEAGLLFFDGKFERVLDSGTWYFWDILSPVTCKVIDMKVQQLEINGQEILTLDKVGIRLNIVCNYKITDALMVYQTIRNLSEQIYTYIQMVVRAYIGRYRLDELLEQKQEIADFVYTKLKKKQQDYFVEFNSCGIKDIILPGEIKDIMNTVLVAEKKAQANVITRREEVASTRSLLNTAKLMDENKTLFKLKELEYLERICEGVGNISLSNGNQILSQLRMLLGTEEVS